MLSEKQLAPEVYQVDRPLHHQLALAAYQESFAFRNLTERYMKTELRRLLDVFERVAIADVHFPSIRRNVDTFDLTHPLQAARLREACYRDLPNPARIKACLKAIDKYCDFLKRCPTIHIPGHHALYLPDIYGPIESPVNRYTIPRYHSDQPPNRNYLEASEYKQWLRFTWSQIQEHLLPAALLKASQLHLMCVMAGETGIRIQEILGLKLAHFNLEENTCLIVAGKGSKGSGHRKRSVPLSPLLNATLKDFLPRAKGEPLFQTGHGQRLGNNTAHHWMAELIQKIRKAGLPILMEERFGWHAFRRTYTRLYLEQSTDIFQLKRNTGWSYTSTISHYLCDSKQKTTLLGPPLYIEGSMGGVGHGAISWQLKQILEAQGILNAYQLQSTLEERLGLRISRVALDKLLKNPPDALRLKTAQILCDFLQLPLEAFLNVSPDPISKHPGGVIQPYGKPEKPLFSLIVDPTAFF